MVLLVHQKQVEMSKQPAFSFSMLAVLLLLVLVALTFSRGLSFWILLLVIEAVAIYVSVEMLTQRMPATLRTQSQDNCYRLDGSRSHRRTDLERKAMRKIRSDLWAAFLTVSFVVTGGGFFVHTYVFPLSLAAEVASALRDNPADFKGELRQRHVDDKFFQWSRSSSTISNREIDQQAQLLWISWPIAFLLASASLVACLALIRFAYFRTLREFHDALSARTTEYLDLDSRRLQQHTRM